MKVFASLFIALLLATSGANAQRDHSDLNQSDLTAKTHTEDTSNTFAEESKKTEVSIQPNPMTDKTVLDFGCHRSNTTLMLFDNVGRIVKHIDAISGHDYVLRKRGLSEGTYFYYLEHADGQIERGKIVVQ